MKQRPNPVLSAVQDHFCRTWDLLAEIIGNIPDEQWALGEMMPAKHVVHIVVGADIFVNDIPLDQWDPGAFLETEARAGGPWNFTQDELWTKQVALARLAEMRERVTQSLDRLDDAALLKPESVHPWTGDIRLGKLLYELRHIQHHLGAISGELKNKGIKPFKRWD